MWFDSIMDDFKNALFIVNKHKGVFVPIFLRLIMHIVIGIILVVGTIITITSGIFAGISEAETFELIMRIAVPASLVILMSYIIYIVLWGLIEVGSINLFRAAINDETPTKNHFFIGIKKYLKHVFTGKLLIHFLMMITSPIWLLLYGLYFIFVGIPTGGWGLLFFAIVISSYFATWTIAIVHNDLGPIKAIKQSFSIARHHFKPLFLILLTTVMMTQYAIALFGPVGMILAGWFLGGVFRTYFNVVIYLTYIRFTDKETFELN